MLPPGKYVVEVIVPQGYELVKEEDKNILLGDAYVAAVTQQFPGYRQHLHHARPGSDQRLLQPEQRAPADRRTTARRRGAKATPARSRCSGPASAPRASFPTSSACSRRSEQAAPFAGASRPLCDRKEVTLNDQMTALVKFYLFSFDARRQPLHRPDHQRLRGRVRPVLATVRRKVRACPMCRLRSGISPARRFPASMPTSGAYSTA